MSGFFGADVEQLRILARQLSSEADELLSITTRLGNRIDGVAWRGPDADKFRNDWNTRLVSSLRSAARALHDASGGAETNARQQEEVSGASGGVSSLPSLGDPGMTPNLPHAPSLGDNMPDFTSVPSPLGDPGMTPGTIPADRPAIQLDR